MTLRRVLTVTLLVSAASISACGGTATPAPVQSYQLRLTAKTDDGDPLEGVRFTTGKRALGVTNGSGALEITLMGSEGQSLPIAAACPMGFVGPERSPALRLATTRAIGSAGTQPIPFETTCTRTLRDVVVVVHAGKGDRLPVMIEGQPKADTDTDGNAHVLLQLPRDARSVNVALDTSTRKQLRPVNPVRVFELDGRDAILIFAPELTESQPHFVPTQPKAPRHIPYRLD